MTASETDPTGTSNAHTTRKRVIALSIWAVGFVAWWVLLGLPLLAHARLVPWVGLGLVGLSRSGLLGRIWLLPRVVRVRAGGRFSSR